MIVDDKADIRKVKGDERDSKFDEERESICSENIYKRRLNVNSQKSDERSENLEDKQQYLSPNQVNGFKTSPLRKGEHITKFPQIKLTR